MEKKLKNTEKLIIKYGELKDVKYFFLDYRDLPIYNVRVELFSDAMVRQCR
jgi:hypothetical protein